MFESDSEVSRLLGHQNNGLQVKILGNGQDDRADRLPKSAIRERLGLGEKINIALLASVIGVKATSEMIDKSPGVVGRLRSGKNGVGDPIPELITGIEDTKTRIQNKALEKADQFLEMLGLDDDSSESLKKASIAEKVVNIYEKLSPKTPQVQNNTQIVFYAPKIRDAKDYQIIETEAQSG